MCSMPRLVPARNLARSFLVTTPMGCNNNIDVDNNNIDDNNNSDDDDAMNLIIMTIEILSYLSCCLADRWGTTVDFTTSFLQLIEIFSKS